MAAREHGLGNEIASLVGAITILGVFIGGVLVTSIIVRGFVLSVLWGWFVVPLFGLPVLSIPLAFALVIVAGTLHPTYQSPPKIRKQFLEEEGTAKRIGDLIGAVLGPLVSLGLGWVVLKFIGW